MLFRNIIAASGSILAASAATIPSHSAQIRECLASNVVKTQTLRTGEHTIELKTASCPGLRALVAPENKSIFVHDSTLTRRSSLECSKPAECQCGRQCSGGCATNGEPVPNQVDCLQLAVELLAVPTPTNFFIETGDVATATFGTCTFAALNLLTTEIEYCIDDFANAAFQLSALCITGNQDAGICEPSTGAVAVEFLSSSS